MGKRVTIVPNRFRQEPLDVLAYDRWQDREGLEDASEACRVAWEGYRSQWQQVRKLDLARVDDAPIIVLVWTNREQHLARQARKLGSAFAMCHAEQRRRPLSASDRRAWWAWRSRCQRADLVAWQALWPLLDGVPLADVSARFGEDPERLAKKVSKLFQWLDRELYPATIRQNRAIGEGIQVFEPLDGV